ncbi:MAG: NAD-dependent epimerase/dehydratase family protein [Planctomycetota bacterium]|nr:NAD-dependent epimerase/dehydratase family protein [Planctomycetota bacterium]
MTKEKFLVTGCAGFIGSHVVRRLLKDGIDTVGVDDFSTGKLANIKDVEGKFRLVEGDLCQAKVAEEAVQGVSHIIHLASIPSVPRSVAKPVESMHSSITASVTLFVAAAAAGVKRIVQAASSAAYGDSRATVKTEDLLPEPLSPYAVAKLTQEYYGRAFSLCYPIDIGSVRYFNVFGPRQDPNSEYSAVIPKFISLMLAGKPPVIFGDGSQSRDFTYVEDIVNGNLIAARHSKPLRGEVFNIASGISISLNQLVEKLNSVLGTKFQAIHSDPRPGDILHSRADISKAKKELAFAAKIDFGEGLRLTADSLRAS